VGSSGQVNEWVYDLGFFLLTMVLGAIFSVNFRMWCGLCGYIWEKQRHYLFVAALQLEDLAVKFCGCVHNI
jgi:hypothetical protein